MINTQIKLALLGYGKECSQKNAALASTVGKFAGKNGISIVGGNVTATFEHAFKAASEYQVSTFCVIEKHKNLSPDHLATEVYHTADTFSKHAQIEKLSDAAIIIGGGSGSQLLMNHFLKSKKTIIAIEGSGGLTKTKLPKQVIRAANPREAFKILFSPKKKTQLATDFGTLELIYDHFALISCKIIKSKEEVSEKNSDPFVRQLKSYLNGKLKEFTGKIHLKGTDFQIKVWKTLLDLPYGKTSEYGEIAKFLGDQKTQRAVGHVSGQNPIWIIIPCHRLISKDGSLTGYAGGLEMKRRLLDIEKHQTELRVF